MQDFLGPLISFRGGSYEIIAGLSVARERDMREHDGGGHEGARIGFSGLPSEASRKAEFRANSRHGEVSKSSFRSLATSSKRQGEVSSLQQSKTARKGGGGNLPPITPR